VKLIGWIAKLHAAGIAVVKKPLLEREKGKTGMNRHQGHCAIRQEM
jgi:hypothetical protein